MHADNTVLITFAELDAASANQLVTELAEFLNEDAPAVSLSRIREDPDTQDFGATLAVVLGSTAVSALAKGIAHWLARRQDAKIHLRRKDKAGATIEVTIEGQSSSRAERIVKSFLES
jgi:hypothetical protein